ncbi:10226_t:CDS:2, partial [Racocetra persica]
GAAACKSCLISRFVNDQFYEDMRATISAKSFVKELQHKEDPNIVIALVGNKIDLVQPYEDEGDKWYESGRQVLTLEVKSYALEADLLFFKASAKKGDNVHNIFTEIAKK